MNGNAAKLYTRIFGVMLAGIMVLNGCGKKDDVKETPESVVSIDYEALYREETVNDILKENWAKEDVSDAETFMSLSEYHANIFKDNDSGQKYNCGYFADSKYIYSLEEYYSKERDEISIYLNKLDISDKSVTVVDYSESVKYALSDPYAVGGRIFASYCVSNADYELTEYKAVELLPDGTISEKADVIEILKAHDWYPEPSYDPEVKLIYEPTSDVTYLVPFKGDCLVSADAEGAETAVFRGFENAVKPKISDFSFAEDGHVLFLCTEGTAETIFIFEDGTPKKLYSGKSGFEATSAVKTVDGHGRVLYMYGSDHNTIVSWNTDTGVQEKIYTEDNSDHRYYVDSFARNEKGELLLLSDDNLRVLSLAGAASKVEITLQPITFMGYQLKKSIERYERTHPGVKFTVGKEPSPSDRDAAFNQMYTDIIDGKGPDLILVYDSYLNAIAEKGCLYELSDVLRPDVRDKLIPAVYDAGRIGDGKYMMAMDANIYTFIINKKYCGKDSWTITDILNIVEQREKEGNPFEWLIVGHGYDENPLWRILYNVCESEFLDADNHTCNFDSEKFVKLLELCKKDTGKSTKGNGSGIDMMKEDRALIYIDYLMSILGYSEDFSKLGEDEFRTIGYPSATGGGNRLVFSDGLSVNKNAMADDPEKKKVIEDFLNCLYMPEYMVDTIANTVPMRLDMFDGRIYLPADYEWVNTPQIKLESGRFALIAGKKDGTSYVNEYLDLLKSCESERITDIDRDKVMSIIDEETAPFFAGEKSAAEVAAIIQNRVKIYLMETE